VRHCLRRARERLEQIWPENGGLPALRAQERLRALEAWLEDRSGKALEDDELHRTLTKVVEETDAACDDLGRVAGGRTAHADADADTGRRVADANAG
jgi:hypothetical protein